ncbi:hypothetical protein [Sinomonas sp. G460-2]|uniref:hypothetical protein n=1 Tax=Sinomonas sp. G460-2 TaxID=3393464 RepID=UPI0039F1423E
MRNESGEPSDPANPRREWPPAEYGAMLHLGQRMPDGYPELADPHRPKPGLDLSLASPGRGAVLALLAVPAGVVLWMALWSVGWMSSLTAFIAAVLAAKLYVLGAGRITTAGAAVVAVVCAATILLGFVGGVWLDAARILGGNPAMWVFKADPWRLMAYNTMHNSNFYSVISKDFLMALLFGALGCFFTLRRLFQEAKGPR